MDSKEILRHVRIMQAHFDAGLREATRLIASLEKEGVSTPSSNEEVLSPKDIARLLANGRKRSLKRKPKANEPQAISHQLKIDIV